MIIGSVLKEMGRCVAEEKPASERIGLNGTKRDKLKEM